MYKTEQLNSLFDKWESSREEYKGRFIRDGIIDESSFEAAGNKKLLIITKEPNYKDDGSWDFRDWWRETRLKYSFSIRISEWAFGIENDFPIYSKIKDNIDAQLNAIRKIAFMNIKKIGGTGSSEFEELYSYMSQDLEFIKTQIRIIEPKIIILCLSWGQLRMELFPEINSTWKDCGYNIGIAKLGDCKIIDFYHPSSRNAPAASYSLLQNVIRSEAFKSL